MHAVPQLIVSTILLVWVSQLLAVNGSQYALVLMGALLLTTVLVAPEGFVVTLVRRVGAVRHKRDTVAATASTVGTPAKS